MSEGIAPTEDGTLHFETLGEGLPVVLVHAGYLDCRMWDGQYEYLSTKYQTVRYDVRGFGKSSNPKGPYSDAADLRSLLDHLGIEKTVLIGVSNGGRISLDFAVEHPDRVRALVLMDFGISGYKSSGQDEDALWDSFQESEERYLNLIKETKFREAAAIDVDIWTPAVSPTMREKLLDIATENVQKSTQYKPDLQVSPEPPAFDRIEVLKMPILMILGERDVPGQIVAVKRMHELLPASEFVIMEGADHIPSLSRPDEFRKVLHDFLERVE